MPMTMYALFGIAAGVLAFVAYPIYIRDILHGNTKPSRVTWWILTISNALLVASYYASGARDTIWIPVSYSIGFFSIAILSLKYGEGRWTILDYACLTGAIASALAWALFDSAETALFMIIAVDFFGLVPTIYKSYLRPWTENRTAWIIAAVASLLNIFAIESWTFIISTYPVYVLLTNGLVAYFLIRSRPREVV